MFRANSAPRPQMKESRIALRGCWQDTRVYQSGRTVVGPWRHNQIQNPGPVLVQALLARIVEDEPLFRGISYMAVGTGDAAWDLTPPTMDRAQDTLTSELDRKEIALGSIAFLDPDTFAPSATPTRVAEYVGTFGPDDANGDLREFGLFGGLADGDADSGLMLNWVTHPVFAKTSDFSLIRRVRITVAATVEA